MNQIIIIHVTPIIRLENSGISGVIELTNNQALYYPSGYYRLVMQGDGNLVMYFPDEFNSFSSLIVASSKT